MKKLTHAQFYRALAAKTGLSQPDVRAFYDAIVATVQEQVGDGGPGVITLPHLVRISVVDKPATEAREGRNPFTGGTMTFQAKPASKRVKVASVKALKDAVT